MQRSHGLAQRIQSRARSLSRRPRSNRPRSGTRIGAGIAGAGIAGGLLLLAFAGNTPRVAAASPFNGYARTGGVNLNLRMTPDTSRPPTTFVEDGTELVIACTAVGQSETGPFGATRLWDRLDDAEWGGFVSDAWVETGRPGAVAGPCDRTTLAPYVVASADERCPSPGTSEHLDSGTWGNPISTCPTVRRSAGRGASWQASWTPPAGVRRCMEASSAGPATFNRPKVHYRLLSGPRQVVIAAGPLGYRSDPIDPTVGAFPRVPTANVLGGPLTVVFDNFTSDLTPSLATGNVDFTCR